MKRGLVEGLSNAQSTAYTNDIEELRTWYQQTMTSLLTKSWQYQEQDGES